MSNDVNACAYSRWLTLFLGLFLFRVLAQLVQAIYYVPFLPRFESWQSGALPYPLLVTFQVAIIAFCVWVILKFRSGTVRRNPRAGSVYLTLGGIYFGIMTFRLVAGLSFATGHPWLGAQIPTIFHLVLAWFLLTIGFYHSPHTKRIVAWSAYPTVMAAALVAHFLCLHNGVGLPVATFGPILSGCLVITFLELKFPHRRTWLANGSDVINDTAYMLLVQIVLPRFLTFFAAITLLKTLQAYGMTLSTVWPHAWPVYFQALLMMVTAELMRYWIHRLAHEWPPLWRLHAIHHSPHKLYWINVGRFHPLEKAIQYLVDALPFIVLGVSEEVLALYFVFYGLNGFFQHCNIEIRMGFLNYLISGPELHRWHHSTLIEESNNNYGNNLIIWDLLFGTWFLPSDRLVGELGLVNRNYPLGFVKQLGTPFVSGLDKAS